LTVDTLAALTELNLPTRDLAVLLAISHQRVQQLRHGLLSRMVTPSGGRLR
jgi:hypothetical protein